MALQSQSHTVKQSPHLDIRIRGTRRKDRSATTNPILTQGSCHTPHTGLNRFRRRSVHEMVEGNVKNHTVQCLLGVWLRTALDKPDDPRWSKDAALRVLNRLVDRCRIRTKSRVRLSTQADTALETDGTSSSHGDEQEEKPTPTGWKAWEAARASRANENTVFSHVVTMFQETCEAAIALDRKRYGEPTTVYKATPDNSTNAEVSFFKPRHDGESKIPPENKPSDRMIKFAREAHATRPLHGDSDDPREQLLSNLTSDTASIAEFKLTQTESESAVADKQIASGATRLLYNDPRRRFVLAFTIEGTSVRFWRFDRSMVLVSERFDCETEPEHLIQFILYVSFASKAQLGFDPTVKICENRGQLSDFIYEIGGQYFRTRGHPLSEGNAAFTISRGVRVWEVVECTAKGEPVHPEITYALHDLWLWDDALSEKEIQDGVLEALKRLDEEDRMKTSELDEKDPPKATNTLGEKDPAPASPPPSRAERMRELFLTIIACEKVMLDGKPDQTIVKPAEACQIPFAQSSTRVDGRSSQPCRKSTRSVPGTGTGPFDHKPKQPESLQHQARVHWRYVVKEVCKTMYDFDNMKAALGVFKDFTVALDLFRQAGYMHRDISGGNCLVYTDPKTGEHHAKLADLEFCKPFAALTCHDPVTGTYEFMAVESHKQALMFRHRPTIIKNRKAVPIYHPHPFHDLESLYWVMVWYILHWYFDTRLPRADLLPYWTWREAVNEYFNSTNSTFTARRDLMRNVGDLSDLWENCGWDMSVLDIVSPCLNFGENIVDVYTALQQKPQVDKKWPLSLFTGELYEEFGKRLGEASRVFPPGHAVAMNSFGSSSPKRQLEVDSNTPDGGDAKKVALSDGK